MPDFQLRPKDCLTTSFSALDRVHSEAILSHYRLCSAFSKRVYPSVMNQRNLGFDEQQMIHDQWGKAFGRVFFKKDEILVAFRGTRDSIDWTTNLRVWPKKVDFEGPCGTAKLRVHQGFSDALDVVYPKIGVPAFDAICNIVRDNMTAGRRLYFTGHSLGGACRFGCGPIRGVASG